MTRYQFSMRRWRGGISFPRSMTWLTWPLGYQTPEYYRANPAAFARDFPGGKIGDAVDPLARRVRLADACFFEIARRK